MKYILVFLLLISCAKKTKSVLVCGDHECVNNHEAERYFKDNLTLEVRVLEKKSYKYQDLAKYNLTKTNEKDKSIKLSKANINKNEKKLKILSSGEKKIIKDEIKNLQKKEKINLKMTNKKTKTTKEKKINETKFSQNKNQVDICKVIEKCDIENISKFILKKSKENKFPDITSLD
ncbi:MAG: hypothetical protein CBD76_04125 [Pelagibacteraceae bacterium TMED216]|nr:MAG: hypothetical protein CBD76_04125 [Pelagibacteraceae bacterium TMED216]|tara:strand:- start:532 stop:1059 length:528 start_codon:yes stop_codon:yes gene_type:complete